MFPPDVEVLQVIRTRLKQAGNGKTTPIRAIEQYWSMEGDLLVEVDPFAPPVDVEAHLKEKYASQLGT